ncbi:MAG TPA: hypothetical protein VIC28_04475 [Thermoanaerobaculia bacterium]
MARRSPWALFLAAVVLLGTLELHAHGETLQTAKASAANPHSLSARHPSQPAHFEAGQKSRRPLRPFRTHKLRTNDACLRPGPVVPPPAPRLAPASDPSYATTGGSHRPSGARAPPSLS